MALGTGQARGEVRQLGAELTVHLVGGVHGRFGSPGFTRLHGLLLQRVLAELDKTHRDLRRGQAVIDLSRTQRALGHTGEQGFARVLDDRYSAAHLDRCESQRPIVQRAREHHTHHTPPVGACGAAKQHVHRRPRAVFARACFQPHVPSPHDQVAIRARSRLRSALARLLFC